MAWPVTKAAASEARKATTAATSSGVPRVGVRWLASKIASTSGSKCSRARTVATRPGHTALQRTRSLPYMVATKRVKAMRPPLADP